MLYVGMTLLLGFGAVNTGNNLLYLLVSALLGFMAISGLLGRANLSRLQVNCRLADEIYAGRPTLIRLKLTNRRRRLPAFLLEAELDGTPTLFPILAAGEERSGHLSHTFEQRGEHPLPRLILRSGYPINFFIRSIGLPLQTLATVFPAPRQATLPAAAGGRRQRAEELSSTAGQDGDLHSINDYRGGEPYKSIHWRLSARHPELKVKQLAHQAAEPVLIDLDELNGRLEDRLGQACQLILELSRQNRPVGLRLSGRRITPAAGRRQKLRLLTELARHA